MISVSNIQVIHQSSVFEISTEIFPIYAWTRGDEELEYLGTWCVCIKLHLHVLTLQI